MVCTVCGYKGNAKMGIGFGEFVIGCFLCLFFLFPGVAYWLWCAFFRMKRCPKCDSKMVPYIFTENKK
jgi:hypothetical protein